MPMPRRRDEPTAEQRGVYLDQLSINGKQWVYAVTSDGKRLGHRVVLHAADRQAVIDDMWDELDRIDATGPRSPCPDGRLRLIG